MNPDADDRGTTAEPVTTMSDAELEDHLGRRGAGPVPSDLAAAIAARVEATTPQSRWRSTAGWRPMAAAAAALVVLVVGAGLLMRTTPNVGTTSPIAPDGLSSVAMGAPPSGGPTAMPPSAPPASATATGSAQAGGAIVWPKDDLIDHVAAGSIPSGRVVVTDLRPSDLVTYLDQSFRSCPQLCPRWLLTAGNTHAVVLQSMLEPVPTTTAGRLAFLVEDRSLRLLGPADTTADGSAFTTDLVATDRSGSSGRGLMFTAVHGWLREGPLVPCPAPIRPLASAFPTGIDQRPIAFSCPWTWIQPTSADPAVPNPDGSTTIGRPPGSLLVQNGAGGADQTPREGDYLVRPQLACPPGVYCAFIPVEGRRWELIGEIVGP